MSFTAHQATAYDYVASAPSGNAFSLSGGPFKVFGTTDGDNCVRAVHEALYRTTYYSQTFTATSAPGGTWFIPTNTPPDYSVLDEQWTIDNFDFEGPFILRALLGSDVVPTDEQDFIPSPDWFDQTEYPWLSQLHESELDLDGNILGTVRMHYQTEFTDPSPISVTETKDLTLTRFRMRWANGASAGSKPTFHGDNFYPVLYYDFTITLPAWSSLTGSPPSPWTSDPGTLRADNIGTYSGVSGAAMAMTDRTLSFFGGLSTDFGTPATGVTLIGGSIGGQVSVAVTPTTEFSYTP